jgi:hypothetical protein
VMIGSGLRTRVAASAREALEVIGMLRLIRQRVRFSAVSLEEGRSKNIVFRIGSQEPADAVGWHPVLRAVSIRAQSTATAIQAPADNVQSQIWVGRAILFHPRDQGAAKFLFGR